MEIPQWRLNAFRVGAAIVVASPIAWVLSINLLTSFHGSDNAWGYCIVTGFLAGVVSVVSLVLGKREGGGGRAIWIAVACIETVSWWFMSVGL